METVLYAVVFLMVSNVKLITGEKNFPLNALNTKNTSPHHLCQQPFSTILYTMLREAGIFDKLFDVPLTPCQAAVSYYKNSVSFAHRLGDMDVFPLPLKVANASEDAFKHAINPMAYFQAYSNTTQDILTKTGTLTPNNTCQLAESYFEDIFTAFKNRCDSLNTAATVDILVQSGANFLLKTFKNLSDENVEFIMSTFADRLFQGAQSKKGSTAAQPIKGYTTVQPVKKFTAAQPIKEFTVAQPTKKNTDLRPILAFTTVKPTLRSNQPNMFFADNHPNNIISNYKPSEEPKAYKVNKVIGPTTGQPSTGLLTGKPRTLPIAKQTTTNIFDNSPNIERAINHPNTEPAANQPNVSPIHSQTNVLPTDYQSRNSSTVNQPIKYFVVQQPSKQITNNEPGELFSDKKPSILITSPQSSIDELNNGFETFPGSSDLKTLYSLL